MPFRSPYPNLSPVRLRRGVLARLRFCGIVEFLSLLGVFIVVLIINDLRKGVGWVSDGWFADTVVVVLLAGAVAVRVAVALEYVEADSSGLRWTSLFRSSVMPWDQIEWIGTSTMYLFPSHSRDSVILLNRIDGSRRRLRPSAWCDSAHLEWIRVATAFLVRDGVWHGRVDRRSASDVGGEASLVVSGFDDESSYLNGGPASWEPDTTFGDVDAAVDATRRWLTDAPADAVAIVIDVRDRFGRVIRVVTTTAVEIVAD